MPPAASSASIEVLDVVVLFPVAVAVPVAPVLRFAVVMVPVPVVLDPVVVDLSVVVDVPDVAVPVALVVVESAVSVACVVVPGALSTVYFA
jgi:hypothetical protein